MSHSENDRLLDNFIDFCESVNTCFYCGQIKKTNETCCGEIRNKLLYHHPDVSFQFDAGSIAMAYAEFLSKRGEK